MKNIRISAMAVAISLAFCTSAMAQTMTKEGYKSKKEEISAEGKASKEACDSLSGNAKDICVAGAKGKENIAMADHEAQYKPTQKNAYEAKVARADADYAVAKEKCDDKAGNVKDVCVKEAKAAQTTAKANAKSQMKTAEANISANEKSSTAQKKANEKSADARSDASSEKRDAEYSVAREKCDSLANDAKDNCIAKAKSRYGKS